MGNVQINNTENRSVLQIALRAPRDAIINSDDKNVVPEVWQVLDKIKDFSEAIRSGTWTFSGNRPSLSLLLPSLNAYKIGQLLGIYEHRIAVERFAWGINSFDQWGVELGKSLATQVRKQFHASRKKGEPIEGFNFSTTTLHTRYLEASSDVPKEDCTVLSASQQKVSIYENLTHKQTN